MKPLNPIIFLYYKKNCPTFVKLERISILTRKQNKEEIQVFQENHSPTRQTIEKSICHQCKISSKHFIASAAKEPRPRSAALFESRARMSEPTASEGRRGKSIEAYYGAASIIRIYLRWVREESACQVDRRELLGRGPARSLNFNTGQRYFPLPAALPEHQICGSMHPPPYALAEVRCFVLENEEVICVPFVDGNVFSSCPGGKWYFRSRSANRKLAHTRIGY